MPDNAHAHVEQPSRWLRRFAPLIPSAGAVLDVACGAGRHARYLARSGHPVEAVDRDAAALALLADVPGIATRRADLENGPWPYAERQFAGIVVTNYLHRPLFPLLCDALLDEGVLIYETFMIGNERFGRPSNPAFLLRPAELLDAFGSALSVVAFEQGEVRLPKPALVQRLCAVKAEAARIRLPEPLAPDG